MITENLAPALAVRSPARQSTLDAIYAAAHLLLENERSAEAAHVFRLLLRVAPRDERGWLGLGLCHERATQVRVAIELYGAGSVVALSRGGGKSVRCFLARARVLADLGLDFDGALQAAEHAAREQCDDDLIALAAFERSRLS
jgi:hypothetical protein